MKLSPTTAAGDSGHPSAARQITSWAAVAVLAAAAVVGSNVSGIRDSLFGTALPSPEVPATSRNANGPPSAPRPHRSALRSTPWWQTVAELDGTGTLTSEPLTIDARAIDWRVTWSCRTGHLQVRAPGVARPVVDADCPEGVGFGSGAGPTSFEVTAEGPWHLEVAQRIELPLIEPLPTSMTAEGASVVAAGSFHKVDRVGVGRLRIFEQAGAGLSVRLDDFWVTPKAALQLRLSTSESPESSEDYLRSDSQLLAVLDVTAGSLNYKVPSGGAGPEDFRSVVIWSPLEKSVYAAARLEQSP